MESAVAIDELLTLLARTPATVRALLEDLPADLLHADEGEGTFSPFDVLGHLIQGELDDWVPRARWMLEHGPAVALPPFDRFAHVERIRGRAFDEMLESFATLRSSNLAELRALLDSGVGREARGTHTELGTVRLRQLLATRAVHDLAHIGRIVRVVARQFESDIGPRRQPLPIPDGRGGQGD